MKMFKRIKTTKTTLNVNNQTVGETIEQKMRRIVRNNEPIKDGAPLIYTERKDGVRPEFNVRADRWELAVEATDYVTRTKIAKRENKPTIGEQAKEGMAKEGGATPANTSD